MLACHMNVNEHELHLLLILDFIRLVMIKEILQESLASLIDSSLAEDSVSLPLLLDDASSSSSAPSSSVHLRLENQVCVLL